MHDAGVAHPANGKHGRHAGRAPLIARLIQFGSTPATAPSKRTTPSGQYFSSMVIIEALLMIAGGTASVSRRGAVSALDEHGGEVGLGEIERGAAGRFAHHVGGDELGDRRQRAEVGGP